jgi:hypothetical protein
MVLRISEEVKIKSHPILYKNKEKLFVTEKYFLVYSKSTFFVVCESRLFEEYTLHVPNIVKEKNEK